MNTWSKQKTKEKYELVSVYVLYIYSVYVPGMHVYVSGVTLYVYVFAVMAHLKDYFTHNGRSEMAGGFWKFTMTACE